MRPSTVHDELQAVPAEKMRHIATSLNELNSLGRVQSDQDVSDRIDAYFNICGQRGMRPGIESLALALGVDRTTIYRWRKGNGCSPERERTIKQATQYIFAFLESLGLSGQLNPASYIWTTKQWMNYKDGQGFGDTVPTVENEKIDTQGLIEKLGIDGDLERMGDGND